MKKSRGKNYIMFTGGAERLCRVSNGFHEIPFHTAGKHSVVFYFT
jgi:hypothetical protein